MTKKAVRESVLQAALDATMGSRNKSYGAPTPNLQLANDLIELVHPYLREKYSPAHNQALYLALHKLARIACGAVGHTDNYVDAAAYFAIAAECEEVAQDPIDSLMGVDVDNYFTTGSDLAEPAKNERLVPRMTGDTEEMVSAIEKQNQDAANSSLERYDHYGESIVPQQGEIIELSGVKGRWVQLSEEGNYLFTEGMIFQSVKYPGQIWKMLKETALNVFSGIRFPSVAVMQEVFYFHRASITHVFLPATDEQSNLKCMHCPANPLPSKDVCATCAMELGQ